MVLRQFHLQRSDETIILPGLLSSNLCSFGPLAPLEDQYSGYQGYDQ